MARLQSKRATKSRLDTALAELRVIEDCRQVIVQWDDQSLNAVREVIGESKLAAGKLHDADQRQDVEEYKNALRDYADVHQRSQVLDNIFREQTRQSTLDRGRVGLLKASFPECKTKLVDALNAKLAVVQENAGEVFAQEKAQLSPEGYDDEQIKNSPRCKRAYGVVAQWESIQRRVAENPVEETWTNVVPQLLADDE